jgi:hypothetical protein
VSKLGRETPSWIRAWSLICIEKPNVLFERHCHATEKSEAIACVRRCRSSRFTRWWTQKKIIGKRGSPLLRLFSRIVDLCRTVEIGFLIWLRLSLDTEPG